MYKRQSYASSTTYVTGKAVEQCALKIREQICKLGAGLLKCLENEVVFDGKSVRREGAGQDFAGQVSLTDIATASMCGNEIALEATVTNSSPLSPPPFMVGAAEVEVDLETGEAKVINYAAAVDCGTPVNPNLARVQAEGGILQGIGMALTENITYNAQGKLAENLSLIHI